ncbi:MAG: hypothetical protein CMM93_03440 [Rickettsiales bacterium]|nr:hypothetical protein [Rickettsiales bacterium]|tara:strand:- start:192 stop:740 length:549 start_codon:yes stop_codon:yes gene_type:complete
MIRSSISRFICTLFSCLLVGIVLVSTPSEAQERVEKIKAVFLFKLLKYIDWPDTDEGYVMCLYGKQSFANVLDTIAQANPNMFTVKHIDQLSELKSCHVGFVSRLESVAKANQLITYARAQQIKGLLLVSDQTDFAIRGGGISFQESAERILVILNSGVLQRAQLEPNSRLMQIAEIVREPL